MTLDPDAPPTVAPAATVDPDRVSADAYVRRHLLGGQSQKYRDRYQDAWRDRCTFLRLDPTTAGAADTALWLTRLFRDGTKPTMLAVAARAVDALPGRHAQQVRDTPEVKEAIAAAFRARPPVPVLAPPVMTAAVAKRVFAVPPPPPSLIVTVAQDAVRAAAAANGPVKPVLDAMARHGQISRTTRAGASVRIHEHAKRNDPRLQHDPAAMPPAELTGAILRMDPHGTAHDLILAVTNLAWQTARTPDSVIALPADALLTTPDRIVITGLGPDIDVVTATDPGLCAVRAHQRLTRRLAGLRTPFAFPTINRYGEPQPPRTREWWHDNVAPIARAADAAGLDARSLFLGYIAECDAQHATVAQIATGTRRVDHGTLQKTIHDLRQQGYGRQDRQ